MLVCLLRQILVWKANGGSTQGLVSHLLGSDPDLNTESSCSAHLIQHRYVEYEMVEFGSHFSLFAEESLGFSPSVTPLSKPIIGVRHVYLQDAKAFISHPFPLSNTLGGVRGGP